MWPRSSAPTAPALEGEGSTRKDGGSQPSSFAEYSRTAASPRRSMRRSISETSWRMRAETPPPSPAGDLRCSTIGDQLLAQGARAGGDQPSGAVDVPLAPDGDAEGGEGVARAGEHGRGDGPQAVAPL